MPMSEAVQRALPACVVGDAKNPGHHLQGLFIEARLQPLIAAEPRILVVWRAGAKRESIPPHVARRVQWIRSWLIEVRKTLRTPPTHRCLEQRHEGPNRAQSSDFRHRWVQQREHVRGAHVARQVVEPLVDLRRRESLKQLLGPFEGLGVQLGFARWRKGEAGRFGSPVPSGIAHGVIEDVINPDPEVRIGNCHDLAADPCRSEPLPLEGCFAP